MCSVTVQLRPRWQTSLSLAIDSFTFCVFSSPKTLLSLQFLCSICIQNTNIRLIRLHLWFSACLTRVSTCCFCCTLYTLYLFPLLSNLRYLNHFTFIPWKLFHFKIFVYTVVWYVVEWKKYTSLPWSLWIFFYCHRQNLVTFYCIDFSWILLFPYKDPSFHFRTVINFFVFVFVFYKAACGQGKYISLEKKAEKEKY